MASSSSISSSSSRAAEERWVEPGRWGLLVTYLSASFGFGFMGMASFLVPLRAQELGAPAWVIGLIAGASSVVSMALSVPAGALADRVGARRVFLLSVALCGVGGLLLWLAENYWMMLAVELAFGFPRTMAWIASQAHVAAIGRPDRRAAIAGWFSVSSNAAGFVAPAITGVIAQAAGYQGSFLVLAPVAALYFVLGLGMPDARHAAAPGSRSRAGAAGFGPALDLLQLRGMQVALLLTFTRIWLAVAFQTFFPIYLADHGFPPALIGLVLASSAVLGTVAALAAGWIERRLGNALATASGLAITGLGVALAPVLATMPLVFLPVALTGWGTGVSLPLLLALIGGSAEARQRGVAMGLRTTMNRVAATIAPVAVGAIIASAGIEIGFALTAVSGWAMLAGAVLLHRRGDTAGGS